MRRQGEVEDVGDAVEAGAEGFPVAFAGFDEGGKFLELLAADGGLGVEGL